MVASHKGSDSAWVRVSAGNRDEIIKELTAGGGRTVSLSPVRSTLEEFLMHQFQQVRR